MPIFGRGGHAENESLGFRLCPRNQRRKCAGIADRAWREGQGAVGRPEPDAGDESAPDISRTHCRYRRVGRVARDCGEGRRPHHRCADASCRSPEISGNCGPCSLADAMRSPMSRILRSATAAPSGEALRTRIRLPNCRPACSRLALPSLLAGRAASGGLRRVSSSPGSTKQCFRRRNCWSPSSYRCSSKKFDAFLS